MAEVQPRPSASRGRSSTRGGRGGHRNGPRHSQKQTNGDSSEAISQDISADSGELGELKQQYSAQLSTLKEMFPDWTDVDLLLGLQDCDGDLQRTTERITEGNVSQFADVKKKTKDRARSKVKDTPTSSDNLPSSARVGRGRGGQDTARGRGRSERGRGGLRGSRGGHTGAFGGRAGGIQDAVPTDDSAATELPVSGNGTEADPSENPSATRAVTSEPQRKAPVPEGPPKKTWASMFATPKPAPAPPKLAARLAKPKDAPQPLRENLTQEENVETSVKAEPIPIPSVADEAPEAEEIGNVEQATPEALLEDPQLEITPSKDELTEDNLEHLPDTSVPLASETAASTVASSRDPGSIVSTPLNTIQQPPHRPPVGGYATTAFKATATPGRSASFQRRVLEQQEAVVMPGNHAVDRAAVQFGSLGLNGELPLDVDEDREEAETRTQPPQHSPTAQPRAALPPAPRRPSAPTENTPTDSNPTPKQAPGLPPVPQQQQSVASHQQSPQATLAGPGMNQQGSQSSQQYSQFGRYGQAQVGNQTEGIASTQKHYDPFGNQTSQFENFASQNQPQQQAQAQSNLGALSSAPNDYSSYYTSDQNRNSYQNYYGFNPQSNANQQDGGSGQQRSGSAFGAGPADTSLPTSQAPQAQARYGETQNSGHTTPNPAVGSAHHAGPQSQQGQGLQHQPQSHSGPYGNYHPYYTQPYYQQYMSQYGYGGQGYGPFGGKSGMYGQPHHGYGVSPQTTSFDQHSSSPANVSGFGASSIHGRDSGLAGNVEGFGRSGSAQPSQSQQHSSGGAGAFGSMPEGFLRSQGSFQGANTAYGQQQSSQQSSNEDALKPFGDSKSGPSPSALGQPGRPGSATNNASNQGSQSSLPPPQSHQQGFGGYPSQYNVLGGLGGHQGGAQNHQGQYGYTGFGNNYGSYGRGGWGGNYSGH